MPDGGRRRDRSRVRASRAHVTQCRACGLWHFPGLACPGSPEPRNAFGIDDRIVMTIIALGICALIWVCLR